MPDILGNPEHPVGGLAVHRPPGVELMPLGRDDLHVAVAMAREQRGLAELGDEEPLRARYDGRVNSADFSGFLALADGQPAGMVALAFRRRLNFATFEGWLSELFVRPAFRGRGIGRALAEAAIAEWRLRRGHRVLAPAPVGAEVARTTLQHLGFTELLVNFRLAPPGAPAATLPGAVSIRSLATTDFDAVTRLIAEFGPHRSPVPDRMDAVQRTFAAHARAVEAGGAGSLVAELEGSVVGVAIVEWHDPFWEVVRQAWIPDLVVTEPVRGRGIGRALLAAALRAGTAAGATEALLESGPRRTTAQRLYASFGFAVAGSTWVLQREE